MALLENPKHEAFAYHLSRGMAQKKAYVQAGYEANDSSASRLAASPVVQERIAELKTLNDQAINRAMTEPNEENFQSLAEMGLTMEWCASAFKDIYTKALTDGQLGAANTAVANIQKLVDINGAGTGEVDRNPESLIKVSEVSGMLGNLAEVIKAAQGPVEIKDPADDAFDITPTEEIVPKGIIAQMEAVIDDDDHTT